MNNIRETLWGKAARSSSSLKIRSTDQTRKEIESDAVQSSGPAVSSFFDKSEQIRRLLRETDLIGFAILYRCRVTNSRK